MPGEIIPKEVPVPVSHIDLFATVLDYLEESHLDRSDGQTLRRYIEEKSYNKLYDDGVAVVELEKRIPVNDKRYNSLPGAIPNLMIRHKNWKLILPKRADSHVTDMLFNLRFDPYEMHNMIGSKGHSASDSIIGKVEHLRCLMVEWMRRVDSERGYYSDPKYNLWMNKGDIREVKSRNTWRRKYSWRMLHGMLGIDLTCTLTSVHAFSRRYYYRRWILAIGLENLVFEARESTRWKLPLE